MKFIKWLWALLFYSKCDGCKVRAVRHSHSEPFTITTIEVYECSNCGRLSV